MTQITDNNAYIYIYIYASQNRTVENKYSDLKRSYSYMKIYINRFIVIKIVAIYF